MSSEFVPDSDPPPGVARRRRHRSRVQVHPAQPERSQSRPDGPKLYEVLAWIDALRDGRARERQFAEKELAARVAKRPA